MRDPASLVGRRGLLLSAAASLLPFSARAGDVCTPRDLAARFDARVTHKLRIPPGDHRIYASLAEAELHSSRERLQGPQYLLVVDSCPWVQAAFLFWRLLPWSYELVGASPASTGTCERAGCVETPRGVFAQANVEAEGALASRIYDFGMHRARKGVTRTFAPMRLQARAARGPNQAFLGTPHSDGTVLLPASLVAFLDNFGVLDASRRDGTTAAGELLPFAGRYMVVVDSEREERPEWAA
jgi:hypothetical protein